MNFLRKTDFLQEHIYYSSKYYITLLLYNADFWRPWKISPLENIVEQELRKAAHIRPKGLVSEMC